MLHLRRFFDAPFYFDAAIFALTYYARLIDYAAPFCRFSLMP